MNYKKSLKILLWTARIWGMISLVFLLFMVGAHLIEALIVPNEVSDEGFKSTREVVTFLAFPITTIIGLGIALKWYRWGGLIATIGIVCFHFLRPDLLFNPMIDGLAFPGLLFLVYSVFEEGQQKK